MKSAREEAESEQHEQLLEKKGMIDEPSYDPCHSLEYFEDFYYLPFGE